MEVKHFSNTRHEYPLTSWVLIISCHQMLNASWSIPAWNIAGESFHLSMVRKTSHHLCLIVAWSCLVRCQAIAIFMGNWWPRKTVNFEFGKKWSRIQFWQVVLPGLSGNELLFLLRTTNAKNHSGHFVSSFTYTDAVYSRDDMMVCASFLPCYTLPDSISWWRSSHFFTSILWFHS